MQWLWQKSGQTLPIRWRKAILVTDVQVRARPPVRMWMLRGQDVSLRQLRLVATGEFQRTVSGVGFRGWMAGDECYTANEN